MNEKNLVPNSERTTEELQEMGRKGGIRSGESRRRKARAEKDMKILAELLLESEDGRRLIEHLKNRLRGD